MQLLKQIHCNPSKYLGLGLLWFANMLIGYYLSLWSKAFDWLWVLIR